MNLLRCVCCLAFAVGCGGRPTPARRCAPTTPEHARAGLELRDSPRIPVSDAPRLGPADAPITVVVFSDFECPFCARARATVADLRALYGDTVRVVWRNLPAVSHPHARLAAEAALEVRAQRGDEAFWRFHDIAFTHQDALEPEDLLRYATLVGADPVRFRAALESREHGAAVDADVSLAERLGVDGTPTFFVNGTVIAGAQPLAVFEELAAAVLRRARTLSDPREAYAAMVADPLPAPPRGARGGREAWERLHDLPVPDDAPSLGARDAPVVVQVFSDFECGFCARLRPTLEALRARFGQRLRLVWRDLPLPRHEHAFPAAEAAREVRAQRGDEAFWRYHDLLFAHQDALGPDDLARYATEVGADAAGVHAALRDHRHAARVRVDVAAAQSTGLRLGTPASFINGHFLGGARPLEEFVARVGSLLPTDQ